MSRIPQDGSPVDDEIIGTRHRDIINALAGNDTVYGGLGHDILNGDEGNDQLFGGPDSSRLNGGDGNDTAFGYLGNDTLIGGNGDDYINGAKGEDWEYGGSGNDTITAGDPFSNEIDHTWGGRGDDFVSVNSRAGGDADGGAGVDTISINWAGAFGPGGPMHVVLTGPGAGAFSPTLTLTLTGFERLNVLTDQGDDTVTGGALNDTIFVSSGNNTVESYGGNDYLKYFASGVNQIDGGDGTDTLRVWAGFGALTLTVSGTDATDNFGSVITNVEKWEFIGSRQGDSATLGAKADTFQGLGGNDTGYGGDGHDRLGGGDGNDALYGGDGNDILSGGKGFDLLTGGAGADVFHFASVRFMGDKIADMESGVDSIHIASTALAGALALGPVPDASLVHDVAVGTGPQFVLRADPSGDQQLVFDANGASFGGEILIAFLDGSATLIGSDILID